MITAEDTSKQVSQSIDTKGLFVVNRGCESPVSYHATTEVSLGYELLKLELRGSREKLSLLYSMKLS